MDDITSIVSFLLDVLCMARPIDRPSFLSVSQDITMAVTLSAAGALVVSMLLGNSEVGGALSPLAVIGVAAISAYSLIFMTDKSIVNSLIVPYMAMVISLRGAEGLLIGRRFRRMGCWSGLVILIIVGATIAVVIVDLPVQTMWAIREGWAILGTILGAVLTVSAFRKPGRSNPFDSPVSQLALLVVFASTLLYVSTQRFESIMYLVCFPIGLLAGIVLPVDHPPEELSDE